MKILNFGSLNIDHVYRVPYIVRPGETLSSSDLKYYAGGKGANQSVAIAKAGGNVYHAGKIGADGAWLQDELKKSGVNSDYIQTGDCPTGHAIIQVTDAGENSIVLFGGGNHLITDSEINETLAGFEAGDYLVLQNEINSVDRIIDAAHTKGMHIFLNPAPFAENVKKWPLEKLRCLIVNETEAMGLLGKELPLDEVVDGLCSRYPSLEIVMTAGGDGAYYGLGSERHFVPSRKVNAVDTTAAGDTFFGYYLTSLIGGLSAVDSMKRAAYAASITVSRPGAMDSIPLASEIPSIEKL